MSARDGIDAAAASARDAGAVRPRRGRAGVARCLSRRAHAPRVADRRPARHRQSDARLSDGALRPGASGAGAAGGPAARPRWRWRPTIRSRAALPRKAHPDLLVLERTVGDNGKLRTVIAVDDVRRTIGFFGSTAGEGGWRVCIVDAADELNAAGANALLKILEEPPANALLLSSATRRAGCCRPSARAAAGCRCGRCRPRRSPGQSRRPSDATASGGDLETRGGRVGRQRRARDRRCLTGGARVREKVAALLAKLPEVDPRALHALGDTLGRDRRRARGLRRHGARLAERELARGARQAGSRRSRRRGSGSIARHARSRSTISTESRWFSTCSAGLPKHPAVDT